jgi:hypothetical protein
VRGRQVSRLGCALASAAAFAFVATTALGSERVASPGWTKPVIVAHTPGALDGLSITTTSRGDKVAVWSSATALRSTLGPRYHVGVYVLVKRHGETHWPAKPVELSAKTSGENEQPLVASDASGRIVVVWESNRSSVDKPTRYAILEPSAAHFSKARAMPQFAGTRGLLSEPVSLLATAGGGVMALWSEEGVTAAGKPVYISASATLAPRSDRWSRPIKLDGIVRNVAEARDGSLVAVMASDQPRGTFVTRLPAGATRWSRPELISKLGSALASIKIGDDGTIALAVSTNISIFAAVERSGQTRFSAPRSLPPPGVKYPNAMSLSLVVTPDGSATFSYQNKVDLHPGEPIVVESAPTDLSPPHVSNRYVFRSWVSAYDAGSGRWSTPSSFEGSTSRAGPVSLQTTSAGRVIAVYAGPNASGSSYLRSAQAPAGSTNFARPRTIATRRYLPNAVTLVSAPGTLAAFWIDRNVMTATLEDG